MLTVQAMGFSTRLILQALHELGAPDQALTYEDIAANVGCSHQTIRRVMKKLQAQNKITRMGGPRGGYHYHVKNDHD